MSRTQRWTLVATVLASATVFLDSTIVNVALPRIGRDLPHSLVGVLEGQTYVYTGYLLSLSTLLILAGALTDAYGRRRMFMLGLAGFGLMSALCGLAPNLETLVVLRVLQGVAGAFLVPGSLALITAGFDGPLRGRAFGIWSGASSGTTLLGPAIGGILVDTISWRAAFLINIPIIAVALFTPRGGTCRRAGPTLRPRASTGWAPSLSASRSAAWHSELFTGSSASGATLSPTWCSRSAHSPPSACHS